MTLRNDRERREYVTDPDHWEQVRNRDHMLVEILGRVRLMRLIYKTEVWYKIQIYQEHQHWELDLMQHVWVQEWLDHGIYQISKDTNAFTYGVSVSQIVDRIKEIDKAEKEERK